FCMCLLASPATVHSRPTNPFPTRRSSDLPDHLAQLDARLAGEIHYSAPDAGGQEQHSRDHHSRNQAQQSKRLTDILVPIKTDDRSEEHTSELQSRENLVCRLLLEKKNTTI